MCLGINCPLYPTAQGSRGKMCKIQSRYFSISRCHPYSPLLLWTVHLSFCPLVRKSAPNLFSSLLLHRPSRPFLFSIPFSPGKLALLFLLLLPPLPTPWPCSQGSLPTAKSQTCCDLKSLSSLVGVGSNLSITHSYPLSAPLNQCPPFPLTRHTKFFTQNEKFPSALFPPLSPVHSSSRSELSLQNIIYQSLLLTGSCRVSNQCHTESRLPHRAFFFADWC